MSETPRPTPPLSPVLLAGFALRPVPLALLRPLLGVAMTASRRRHPDVFERLDALGDVEFLIDPVDLPLRFLLRPAKPSPFLKPIGDGEDAGQPAAIIHGPLLRLIDLVEGRVDGDALFFSRDIVIEGDTEAVLTLRNAVDSGEIDLVEDLLSFLGPLHAPARHALSLAGAVFARAAHDLEALRAAFVAPIARRCDLQDADLRELEEKLAELRRHRPRVKPTGHSAAGTDES